MDTIKENANTVIAGCNELQDMIHDGATIPQEMSLKLLSIRRAAAKIMNNGQSDNRILAGYKGDTHNQLKQLIDIVERQGTAQLMQDDNSLHLAILAASNFVQKGENYLKLSSELQSLDEVEKSKTNKEVANA